MRSFVIAAGVALFGYLAWGVGFHAGYAEGRATGYSDGWVLGVASERESRSAGDTATAKQIKADGFCHYADLMCR